ncbi:hypothetical protein [Bacillus toyonensis]|uniref:hypothetical protein n=1 Tax=Bacillus toyonensis TaxID=155322 RepID=UPI000BF9BEE1|nr:hypothetical protein [Bacillus toyonensis]PEO77482.1 hypothetical protein CN570_19120 [Bacillus toyonensis]
MEKSISINPQEYSYAFRLSKYDCFKVRTGTCSLHLTDAQYQKIKEHEKNQDFKDGSVDYCRLLSAHMFKNDWFKKNTLIDADQYKCGHVAFGNGQHRTCIAKTLKQESLILNTFKYHDGICRVCSFKKSESRKTLLQKLIDNYNRRKRKKFATYSFIDDEGIFYY